MLLISSETQRTSYVLRSAEDEPVVFDHRFLCELDCANKETNVSSAAVGPR